MSWCWLARCTERPSGVLASAAVRDRDGRAVGFLAAWAHDADPPERAAKVDPRAIDADGQEALVSLVLAADGAWLPFDDPAVSGAIRAVLALPAPDVLSTLLLGDDRFVGALTAVHGPVTQRLDHDPFGAIFPALRLWVGAGLLGHMPPPVGPSMQRYGSGSPWPWERFDA